MKVYIGNDHAGVDFVKEIILFLESECNAEVVHIGTFSHDSVDYPDYGSLVGIKVMEDIGSFGIVVCGTGIGIGIAANKILGIRCANCVSPYMAEMARHHNDANILALGARILDIGNAKIIVKTFFETDFEGGRHQKRVDKLNAL